MSFPASPGIPYAFVPLCHGALAPVISYRLSVISYRLSVISYRLSVISSLTTQLCASLPLRLCASYQLSVIGYQFLVESTLCPSSFVPLCLCASVPLFLCASVPVISYRLSVISYQLSVISYRLSVISSFRKHLSSFVPLCLCAFVPFFVPLCLCAFVPSPFVPLCLSSSIGLKNGFRLSIILKCVRIFAKGKAIFKRNNPGIHVTGRFQIDDYGNGRRFFVFDGDGLVLGESRLDVPSSNQTRSGIHEKGKSKKIGNDRLSSRGGTHRGFCSSNQRLRIRRELKNEKDR